MRWVFFGLLIVNVLYLTGKLILGTVTPVAAPDVERRLAGGTPLVLLAERGTAPAATNMTQAGPQRVRRCLMAGPWGDRAAAGKVLAALPADWSGDVHALRVTLERLNWVYLPPAPSREEALRILRELQNRQVDSFLVGEGDDRNAISLGYFTRADSARGLMVRMRSEGYPAEIRETARTLTEIWLRFPVDAVPDPAAARARLEAAGAREVREAACE